MKAPRTGFPIPTKEQIEKFRAYVKTLFKKPCWACGNKKEYKGDGLKFKCVHCGLIIKAK